jgi:NAD(P)-dependent dehydrogenase (short-subunit alcohol dehydrogenase family)
MKSLDQVASTGVALNTTNTPGDASNHFIINQAGSYFLTGNLDVTKTNGIRVNGVAPGPIWTPLIPASFSADEVTKFGQHVPLGRPGQPNEVAPCHLFLACEDSSYMTGQVLHPNGGEIVGG